MNQVSLRQYEAMFLFDPTFGSTFENCEQEIRRLLERAEAQILFCRKWDERRLAYKVNGRKRGVYVLVYFQSCPTKIRPLEHDARLSEHLLRLLVLRADGLTREDMERAGGGQTEADMEKPTPTPTAQKAATQHQPEKAIVQKTEAKADEAQEPRDRAASEAESTLME